MSNLPPSPIPKRRVGRPKAGVLKKLKISVSIKPSAAEHLLSVGEGNLSRGIEAVTEFHKTNLINSGKNHEN